MKSYDSVGWDFVLVVIHIVGFPLCMVNWISKCISMTRLGSFMAF
jgi:hypothetical protein